ncbi:hypothetical protein MJ572_13780 [Escherichia coli]|nr:hypothetical protein MJ572_13780 [Escherichia coli]
MKTGGGDTSFTLGNTGGFVDLGTCEYCPEKRRQQQLNLTTMSNPTRTSTQTETDPKPDPNRIRNQTRPLLQRRHPSRRNASRLLQQPYSIWQQHYRWSLMLS